MAEALYICTKDELGGAEQFVNGLRATVINKDDGQTDVQILADAALQAGAGMGVTLPSTYFTTATKISDLSSGPLKDNKDAYLIFPHGVVKVAVQG